MQLKRQRGEINQKDVFKTNQQEMSSPSDSYPTANTVAPPNVPPPFMTKQG